MKLLLVLVEGQTEEQFVRDVLDPHLQAHGIGATAVVLKTKRVKSGGHFRGGVRSWGQIRGDLDRLMGHSGARAITTVIDYYALPSDVPGMSTRPSTPDPHARVIHVESQMQAAIADPRFIPHLALHEYEAWLFAEPRQAGWVFPEDPGLAQKLEVVRDGAGGAERIDEGPSTAPSKRLLAAYPWYKKTLHGPMAVEAAGLAAIRARCPHVHEWLESLEAL